MRQTKVMLLPSKPNRALINILRLGYVDERFQHLADSVAAWLVNPLARDSPEFSQALFKVINNVILDNVMHYTIEKDNYHFVTVLGYNQFFHNCRIRVKYLDELFNNWSPLREDKEEAESAVVQFILQWIVHFHTTCHDEFNAVLMELYEAMFTLTPHRYVHTYRFEIDPYLRPLLIYTDCVDETLPV